MDDSAVDAAVVDGPGFVAAGGAAGAASSV